MAVVGATLAIASTTGWARPSGPSTRKTLRRAVVAERGARSSAGRLVADHDRVTLGAELGGEARALGDGAERVLVERALVVQRVDQDPAHARSFLSSSQATIFSTVSFVSSSSMICPASLAGGAAKSLQWARALS